MAAAPIVRVQDSCASGVVIVGAAPSDLVVECGARAAAWASLQTRPGGAAIEAARLVACNLALPPWSCRGG
jgi:hypothetical protein